MIDNLNGSYTVNFEIQRPPAKLELAKRGFASVEYFGLLEAHRSISAKVRKAGSEAEQYLVDGNPIWRACPFLVEGHTTSYNRF